jgi:hypothetical protein
MELAMHPHFANRAVTRPVVPNAALLTAMAAALVTVLALAPLAPVAAQTGTRFEAELAGHAILPAATFVPPPKDAPQDLAVSGRFTAPGNLRNDAVGSQAGMSGSGATARPTGLPLPFNGQPVQGFSGIKPAGDGSYWVLTDNGFGNKRNSPDALLMFHRVRPDFRLGEVKLERTVFIADPLRRVPFRIALEGSKERYLTGADFDPESIQPVGESFWIGEEFGPYLFQVDRNGVVQAVIETRLDGKTVRSPDHPSFSVPASPTATVKFETVRSGGFEGMAASPDGKRLYAMLEKPMLLEDGKPEGRYVRVIEFDTDKRDWTGRSMRYPLDEGVTSIGDFNMIDERRALVIERDDGEGDPARACAAGQTVPPCFHNPARVKRVYLVDLGNLGADNTIRKIGYIDLMAIRDPNQRSRQNGDADVLLGASFKFPFFTIENVARVDAEHIIVANDNNLPFSAGRHLAKADDNEFILLRVPELLNAR